MSTVLFSTKPPTLPCRWTKVPHTLIFMSRIGVFLWCNSEDSVMGSRPGYMFFWKITNSSILRGFVSFTKRSTKLYILSIISRYKSCEIIAYFPEKRLNPKVPRLWWSKCLMHSSTDHDQCAKFPETSFGFPEGYKMGTYEMYIWYTVYIWKWSYGAPL